MQLGLGINKFSKVIPNLFPNPTLSIDSNIDGIADSWSTGAEGGPTSIYSIDDGQKIEITNSIADNSNARIFIVGTDLVVGTKYNIKVDFRVSDDSRAWFWTDFFNLGWSWIDGFFSTEVTPATWTRYNYNITVPVGAAHMIMHFANRINTGQIGSVWIRNVSMKRRS